MAEPDNLKVSTSVVVDLAAERFGREDFISVEMAKDSRHSVG